MEDAPRPGEKSLYACDTARVLAVLIRYTLRFLLISAKQEFTFQRMKYVCAIGTAELD